ncbi:MAG: hypothetical protein ACI4QA_00420 [Candidatus Spyradosoma sp.]
MTPPRDRTPLRRLAFAAALAAVFVCAAWMRFHGIAERPMHVDEAVQAFKVGEMLAGGTYRYDPSGFHGPTLYFFAFWLCRIFGVGSFAEMTETLVRAVPACVGALACVAVPLSFFGRKAGALVAGLLLAFAPVAVFFDAYFIQETLLVAFAWTAAGVWFFREKNLRDAALAGTLFGLAVASKETWILMAAAFACGAAADALVRRRFPPERVPAGERSFAARALVAVAAAGTVAALFYSSFGANPRGLADFFVAFKNYFFAAAGTESPHAKPFFYHAALLTARQPLLVALACVSGVAFAARAFSPTAKTYGRWFKSTLSFSARAFFQTAKERRFQCRFSAEDFSAPAFCAAASLALFTLYSAMPYKTPWLVLGVVPGLALFVGAVLESRVLRTVFFTSRARTLACVAAAGALVVAGAFLRTLPDFSLRYEHAPEPLAEIVPVVASAKRAFAEQGGEAERFFAALAGRETWPLPWLLRRERVGFWETLADVPEAAPFVVAETEAWEAFDAARPEDAKKFRTVFCAESRPGVVLEAREKIVGADD